jgi:hypothetical protein
MGLLITTKGQKVRAESQQNHMTCFAVRYNARESVSDSDQTPLTRPRLEAYRQTLKTKNKVQESQRVSRLKSKLSREMSKPLCLFKSIDKSIDVP